jgi:hypothetical protein
MQHVQRIIDVDAAPKVLSRRAGILLALVLSLVLWGVIWSAVIAIARSI